MLEADLDRVSLKQSLDSFCSELGYEGVVVDVTKNTVTIFSRRSDFSTMTQAVIYEQDAQKVFLKAVLVQKPRLF